MTLDELHGETREQLAQAAKSTMVGDQAVPIMKAMDIANESVHRAYVLGSSQPQGTVDDMKRLELACLVLSGMADKDGCICTSDAVQALALVDYMIRVMAGGEDESE